MVILEKVNGYKSYIAGVISILSGLLIIINSLQGDSSTGTISDGVQAMSMGLAVFGLRHAVEKK